MKVLVRIFAVIGAVHILVTLVVVGVLLAGRYDVGAAAGHTRVASRTLDEIMERSVRAHARSVSIPAGVNVHDPALAQRAVDDYNEMCLLCHGAPGQKAAFWTRGLYPSAPDLTDRLREGHWTDTEIYWIIKHGIKDTGMTAFGATHDEDELWALTALVRQFSTLTPAEYRAWTARARSAPAHDDHAASMDEHRDPDRPGPAVPPAAH